MSGESMSVDEVGHHDVDVFQFKMGAVTIVGDPKRLQCPRPTWTVPSEQLKSVEGQIYFKVEGHKSKCRRLLCCHIEGVPSNDLYKVIRATDVLAQIEDLKNQVGRSCAELS